MYQLLVFRPSEHRQVPKLVHWQQVEWALHRGRMGWEGRLEASHQESHRGRCLLPREEGLGIHTLDSGCLEAHAREAYNASWSKACKYFHWLAWKSEGGRLRTQPIAELADFWGLLTCRYTTIHESRGPPRQRIWLEEWCVEHGLHCLRNLHAKKPFQARW